MDGIRLAPCPNCFASGWIDDGMGDWIRCWECNPEPKAARVYPKPKLVWSKEVENGTNVARDAERL